MVDTKRMNRRREEVKKSHGKGGGDLLTFEEGETKCLVHGQTYPDDDHELTRGYNFVEVVQHYGVGGKKSGVVCLDPVANPIINHPKVKGFLAKRKKPVKLKKSDTCPVCDSIRDGDISGSDAERQKGQGKWIFGLTPMYFRRSKEDEWSKRKFEGRVHIAGVTIFNGLTGAMIDAAPDDITDPEAATLIVVNRSGKGFDDTEYEVKEDRETSRKPLKLDKAQRRIVSEAIAPGGPCDLFKVVANFVKAPAEIKAQMVGVKVEDDEPAGGEDDERKECFGLDWEADDEECQACPDVKDCEKACDGDAGGDTDAEEEDRSGASDDSGEDSSGGDDESGDDGDGDDAGSEAGGDEEPPPCFGEWEDGHPDCKICGDVVECEAKTSGGDGEQETEKEESEPEEEPEPEKEAEAESKEEAAEPEGDPDLDAIQQEADRLAAKGGKGKGKAGKGKAGKGKAAKSKGKGRGGKK